MAVVTNDPGILINGTYIDNFEALMQALALLGVDTYAIQQAGINTLELFKEALANEQIVPITTVREVIVGFAQVKGVDPATTTDVSTRVMTDVAVGTGGSVVSYSMAGNKTLGLVAKAVAVGAVLSLLVSEIGAFLVPDEVQEDLITSADPYTIDHENIPVLIDENGKTHFEADFIEAIRARAIELGVFSSEDAATPIPAGNFTPQPGTQSFSQWFNAYCNTWRIGANDPFDRYGATAENYISLFEDWFSNNNVNLNDYVYVGNASQTSGNVTFFKKNEIYTLYYDDANYWRITAEKADYGVNAKILQFVVSYSNEEYITFRTSYGSTRARIPNEGYNPAANGSGTSNDFGIPTTSTNPPEGSNWAYCILRSFDITPGGGVDGLTPAADLIQAGIADTTKSIAEVIPALGNGEEISSPTVSDLLNKGVWYPISILKENVFTEGATETDTSSAPNGDVSPEMEPDILDKIKELIEEALRDPDNPDTPVQPTIPVGDSGDSPPADPSLISGTGNGLWGIYNPNLSDVQAFGSWLWSSNIVDQIMRMFNSPIEAVIGFHMIYCTPIEGSVENIKCGFLDSGVSSPTVANQYVTIDCGTIDIPEYYHTALDYIATKLMLYLPFIGMIPLATEVCMGSRIQVLYRIDVLTGTCLAQVKVIKDNSEATMYAFPGNCAVQIPLTATTYTGMVGVLISGSSAVGSLLSGNLMSAVRHGANALASGINNLSGTQQSGSLGSNSGALGPRKPYLIITHPIAYDAMEYNTQYGYPINKTVSLGSLTGYTKVKDIHLSGVPCTDNELELIEQLLKEGVIIN